LIGRSQKSALALTLTLTLTSTLTLTQPCTQLYHQQRWDITFVGTPEDVMRAKEGRPADKWSAASKAEVEINEEDNLVFSGERPQGACVYNCSLMLTHQ